MRKTGWPPGMLQDDDSRLSRWLANRPGARYQVRKNLMEKQPEALRLADMIERYNAGVHSQAICERYSEAAAELRRLHARDHELCAAWARAIQRNNELEAEAASLREQNDKLDQQLAAMEREFRQLLDKHNALHMNARAGRERIAELEQALRQAGQVLESDPVPASAIREALAWLRCARGNHA